MNEIILKAKANLKDLELREWVNKLKAKANLKDLELREWVNKLKAKANLKDLELREWVNKLSSKIEVLNERTKRQTIEIKELQKELKKL